MVGFSSVSNHDLFLQGSLRENAELFPDVQICCANGSVKQNRIFLGIIETYLQKLPEFCMPDAEALVMFPEVSLEEYFDVLNEKIFSLIDSNSPEIEVDINCSNDLVTNFRPHEILHGTADYEVVGRLCLSEDIEQLEIVMDDIKTTENISVSYESRLKEELVNFNQHYKHIDKKFKCNYCEKLFAREKSLLAHKSNFHNESVEFEAGKKPFLNCSFCKAIFEAPVQLEKHLRSHSKSKPFQCNTCNKRFVSKSNLSAHQRLHEGTALRYPCYQCEKKFSHPSEVKQHMVVHTGIRAYTCKQCGNKYSRYPSLWKHMKKCNYSSKVVLVQPIVPQMMNIRDDPQTMNICKDSQIINIREDPKIMNISKDLQVLNSVSLTGLEESEESVVVDEIIVTDNIGNDLMLPDNDPLSVEASL